MGAPAPGRRRPSLRTLALGVSLVALLSPLAFAQLPQPKSGGTLRFIHREDLPQAFAMDVYAISLQYRRAIRAALATIRFSQPSKADGSRRRGSWRHAETNASWVASAASASFNRIDHARR